MRIARLLAVALAFVPVLAGSAAAYALSEADLPAPTSVVPVTGTATVPPWDPSPPTLTGVRTGKHGAYDRTVLDFTGGTPGYRVEYAPLVAEGTGDPVPVEGAATLRVVLTGAHPAIDLTRVYDPRLPTLRQIRSGGAYEGHITFGLGMADRLGFRVLRLANPPRIAVDVAHRPAQPFTTERFQGGTGTAAQVQVTGVRFGAHPGYDRVVLDLGTASTPLIGVAYTVPNPSTIHIGLTAATTQRGTAPAPRQIPLTRARSIAFDVYDNGTVSAFITTTSRSAYRVMLLSDPARIVVDIQH